MAMLTDAGGGGCQHPAIPDPSGRVRAGGGAGQTPPPIRSRRGRPPHLKSGVAKVTGFWPAAKLVRNLCTRKTDPNRHFGRILLGKEFAEIAQSFSAQSAGRKNLPFGGFWLPPGASPGPLGRPPWGQGGGGHPLSPAGPPLLSNPASGVKNTPCKNHAVRPLQADPCPKGRQ